MLHANSRFLTARPERFGMTRIESLLNDKTIELLLDEITFQKNIHLFVRRR
jgi:hypothetical protein